MIFIHSHRGLTVISYLRTHWYKIFLILGVFFILSQYSVSNLHVEKSYHPRNTSPLPKLVSLNSKRNLVDSKDLIYYNNETGIENEEGSTSEVIYNLNISENVFGDITASYNFSRIRRKFNLCPLIPPNLGNCIRGTFLSTHGTSE